MPVPREIPGGDSANVGALRSGVAAALSLAFVAVLLLHIVEPDLSLTWSYAHLGRSPWRIATACLVAIALPALVVLASRVAFLKESPTPWPPAAIFAAWGALAATLLAIGQLAPAPVSSLDAVFFERLIDDPKDQNARWYLILELNRAVVGMLDGRFATPVVIRAINALMASVALLALAACARDLARDRLEMFAIGALAWTAFGVIQLCLGYSDVYPVPLAATAAYTWLGLRSIHGRGHCIWPLLIAGVGPFIYLGLVLLGPSAVWIVAQQWRRPEARRQLGLGLAAAVVLAGLATWPGYGMPFAFFDHLEALRSQPALGWGRNPDGYQLPLSQIFHAEQLQDVLHLMLLIDPVGWICTAILGVWLAARRRRLLLEPQLLFLGLLAAPYLVFLLAMDPLWGTYSDWDLFSYGAVATSLLGSCLLVWWGRSGGRAFPLVAGLAIAVAVVHLIARLHALDVDAQQHHQESPRRVFLRSAQPPNR